jgi:hypothetical protein
MYQNQHGIYINTAENSVQLDVDTYTRLHEILVHLAMNVPMLEPKDGDLFDLSHLYIDPEYTWSLFQISTHCEITKSLETLNINSLQRLFISQQNVPSVRNLLTMSLELDDFKARMDQMVNEYELKVRYFLYSCKRDLIYNHHH